MLTEKSPEYKFLRFLNTHNEDYDIQENKLKTVLGDLTSDQFYETLQSLKKVGYIGNKELREKGLTITDQGKLRLNQIHNVIEEEERIRQVEIGVRKNSKATTILAIITLLVTLIGGGAAGLSGLFRI
jgi:DNA-binding PadR family transcriptional regulator